MSEYTPTTEEVRDGWVRIINEDGSPSMLRISPEDFDRWLAEVKAQEAKAERERIKQRLWDDGYLYEMERDHVWALIEGETE